MHSLIPWECNYNKGEQFWWLPCQKWFKKCLTKNLVNLKWKYAVVCVWACPHFNLNWKLESMIGKFAAIHFHFSLQERFMVLWLVLVKWRDKHPRYVVYFNSLLSFLLLLLPLTIPVNSHKGNTFRILIQLLKLQKWRTSSALWLKDSSLETNGSLCKWKANNKDSFQS